jgi:pimeloyl-ACP methyl ester carboxylesterase
VEAINNDVILFAYGGSWRSGRKEMYSFLGKRLARKGYVAVIIDYPLAPKYKIQKMSLSVAQAIKWTAQNIKQYGGDEKNIYVAGHSAGGHLIALNTVTNRYFDSLKIKNPIKGAILIDAAGLDMFEFLKAEKLAPGTSYLQAFTNDPAIWKSHSPLYFLDKEDPEMLILLGGKTYPGITSSTKRFIAKMDRISIEQNFHLQKNKKHIPMMTQFFWPWSKTYKWIEEFTN